MRKNNIYDVLRVNDKMHLKGVKMYVNIKLLITHSCDNSDNFPITKALQRYFMPCVHKQNTTLTCTMSIIPLRIIICINCSSMMYE